MVGGVWPSLFMLLTSLLFSGQVLHYHLQATADLFGRLAEQEHRLHSLETELAQCSHAYSSLLAVGGGSPGGGPGGRGDDHNFFRRLGSGAPPAQQLLDCQLERDALRTDRRTVLLEQQVDALTRQVVNLDPAARRAYRRLVYVVPFITAHVPRLERLFGEHWARYPPCDRVYPMYASYVDLVLYANRVLGDSDAEHHQLAERLVQALRQHGADQCFGRVSVQIANFSAQHDPETYQRKPIADQFFQVYQAEVALARYDFMAYFEPDTLPIRRGWLTRLYEEVEFGGDFWIKGSMYRGPAGPLEFCYSLCGCAEHMNGNAVYSLQAPALANFMLSVHRKMDFLSYNFDAFIMNQLKAAENWPFWQANAHRFQYTELWQHGQHAMRHSQLRAQFPQTYLVHQALYD